MAAVPPVLDERFRAAAATSGELDVAYDVLDDTPVRRLLVGVSDRGLGRGGFDPEPDAERAPAVAVGASARSGRRSASAWRGSPALASCAPFRRSIACAPSPTSTSPA